MMKWLLIYLLTMSFTVKGQQPGAGYRNFAKKPPISAIAGDQYLQHQAFFCRKEWQLEQKIKIPVRIRVGSIEQCNYLEQKPGYTLQVK